MVVAEPPPPETVTVSVVGDVMVVVPLPPLITVLVVMVGDATVDVTDWVSVVVVGTETVSVVTLPPGSETVT